MIDKIIGKLISKWILKKTGMHLSVQLNDWDLVDGEDPSKCLLNADISITADKKEIFDLIDSMK